MNSDKDTNHEIMLYLYCTDSYNWKVTHFLSIQVMIFNSHSYLGTKILNLWILRQISFSFLQNTSLLLSLIIKPIIITLIWKLCFIYFELFQFDWGFLKLNEKFICKPNKILWPRTRELYIENWINVFEFHWIQ
jgi:hypothetical protein